MAVDRIDIQNRVIKCINDLLGEDYTYNALKHKNIYSEVLTDDLDSIELDMLIEDEFNIEIYDGVSDNKTPGFGDIVTLVENHLNKKG